MASRFQAAALVSAPQYPNAAAWSDENLIAVASGHLVTILNPALPFGPRGLITIPECEPYSVGVVKREDVLGGCLLSASLKWDRSPCVKSVSWSPVGMAPNAGCLLAVCTTEGRVKVYRPPFCDFGAEWIEVVDISDKLYDYLASINYGEVEISAVEFSNELAPEDASVNDMLNPVTRKERKRRRVKESGEICSNNGSESCEDVKVGSRSSAKMARIVSMSTSKGKPMCKIPDNCAIPSITADQYASRSAMLHSLVLAWSPVLRLSSQNYPVSQNNLCNWFSILAVGGKSGKISFWRICMPESYSIEHDSISTTVAQIGLLHAHGSWITAISWALISSNSSDARALLVTGSCDGSVKIWTGYGEELLKAGEVHVAPFVLLKEVASVNNIPVSVLSFKMLAQSSPKMLLAIGRGSGSFEVWICDVSSRKFDKIGSHNVHDKVVTGLACAFDGCYLYSCSQDNFVRGWALSGRALSEVPIPSNTPGVKSCTDLPDVFLTCLGLAVSPGNLVIAVVRVLDRDALDHMYEKRALQAEVEFFWLGGQGLEASLRTTTGSQTFCDLEAFADFSEKELATWESNILWSLRRHEDSDKPLVIWDVVAALLAFKRSVPKYVKSTVDKWISNFYPASHGNLSTKNVTSCFSENVSMISSRRLQLFNSICRSVLLSELKADEINQRVQDLKGLSDSNDGDVTLWMELLFNSERELRERLVGISFSCWVSLSSHSADTASQSGCWYPVGIAQMEQWVSHNHEHIRRQLKVLALEVVELARRIKSSEYVKEEQCTYCSARVPFHSAKLALCQDLECANGHKLVRCAVSMQVCPATPLWFCKCCHRSISKLPPESLFTMPRYPEDTKNLADTTAQVELSKPWCPFCGILLQRLQPGFLLSASPV